MMAREPKKAPKALQICHLIKGLGRGGAEGLIPQLLRTRDHGLIKSVGYFLPWKDAFVEEIEAAGARVKCFRVKTNAGLIATIPAVAAWIKKEQPDLVHAHLPLAGVVARVAGRMARVPVVYTEHNLQERYHPWTRRANKLTWRLQDRVVAVSAEVAASALHTVGDRVPVTVIRNGIEIPSPPPPDTVRKLRRKLGFLPNAPVVGTVAVLRRQKRLDLWLEAAARLSPERPDVRFLIVGDGPERETLENRAAAPDLAGRVTFTGLKEEVVPYLAAMDLFMTSSQFEGLPLALLEAMAAGLPVVATPVGGVGEVVEHGTHALLVPFGDPAGLADAAARLMDDPALGRRLAKAARRQVAEHFGIERMARELETLYREVLG